MPVTGMMNKPMDIIAKSVTMASSPVSVYATGNAPRWAPQQKRTSDETRHHEGYGEHATTLSPLAPTGVSVPWVT